MKHIVLLLVIIACAGCSKHPYLSVQTLYFNRESLASYYVESPDPLLLNPPVGQKLLVSWSIPRSYMDYDDPHLNIRMRFRNLEEVTFDVPLQKACGYYQYVLPNDRFFETKGIQTYKVDLIIGDCVIEEWQHQLWHELIKIGDDQN